MTSTDDLTIVNANICTVDRRDSLAEAALIRKGRFALVGSEGEVRAAASAGAEILVSVVER